LSGFVHSSKPANGVKCALTPTSAAWSCQIAYTHTHTHAPVISAPLRRHRHDFVNSFTSIFRPPGALSLSVRDYEQARGDIVKHYKIKYHPENGSVCITTKKVFPNLVDLINHYSSHADGLCCRLTKPCPRPPPDDWEISRSSLVLQERLGAGQFGEVWRGQLLLLLKREWNGTTPVAIKTLKQGTMTKEEFLKEARIMKTLSHAHLVRLFAVVTTEPIYIVTELMSNGSLLHYLRSEKGKALVDDKYCSIRRRCFGMAYLEDKGLVHRDLAARNILVGDNNIVKVADFGLTRAIDITTEFPIKWTAPEAACRGQFTIKSDVWSFGVVIYEIVTYGQQPFPSMNNTETLDQVNNGYRMPCPQGCPSSIYEVMLQTWDVTPELRPTFTYLCEFFEDYVADAQVAEDGVLGGNPNPQYDPGLMKRRPGYPYMDSPARFSPI
uniref:non-specific protein-tyrosine kinase n=1 Tax=Mesocestoides corti TaxID=53468 RepID=A0A0R3U6V2_MESCO